MRLKLYFGLKDTPIQCDWNKEVKDFPKVVNYNHKNWEWIAYNALPISKFGADYELIFGDLKIYDPRAIEVHPTLAMIIGSTTNSECDCGADKHQSSGGHWKFCKLYGRK